MSTETQQGGSGERHPEGPTESLVSASVGDRCVNCGTPLASDQRYCTVCGERRGAARFSLPTATPAAASSSPAPRRDPRRPRVSSGATLVAGVGTLLLAIGVGVLIGHDSSNNKPVAAASRPTVITVNGGTAAPAATTGSSSSTGAGSSGASSSTGGSSKSKGGSTSKGGTSKSSSKKSASSSAASKSNAAAAAAAAKAAAKVTGGSGASAPATVTVGGSAPKGTPGTNKKGKFTGSFFGGG
jgi:hypothetical protein